jgi:hypothetical protein
VILEERVVLNVDRVLNLEEWPSRGGVGRFKVAKKSGNRCLLEEIRICFGFSVEKFSSMLI